MHFQAHLRKLENLSRNWRRTRNLILSFSARMLQPSRRNMKLRILLIALYFLFRCPSFYSIAKTRKIIIKRGNIFNAIGYVLANKQEQKMA